jgi:hypothetical protein
MKKKKREKIPGIVESGKFNKIHVLGPLILSG